MDIVVTVLAIIVLSYLGRLVAKRVKISSVVVLILIGLLLGVPLIKGLLIEPNSEFVFSMGDLGILALMFLAGMESSVHSMYTERRDAVFIALFTVFTSFILGFAVFMLLGFSILVSSIVGICMSITAEATRASVLLELKKLKTRVGSAMMGAGIIDDIFGLSLFILITYVLKEVYIREDLLIAGAILAFFVGVAAQRNLGRDHTLVMWVERVLLTLMIPFFFVSIGLHFDFGSILIGDILIIILVLAISGKLIGSFLAKPFMDFSWKQLHLIGWSMNSRGAVGLALALIAFRSGLIPTDLYSSLIIMAMVSDLVFAIIVTRMIKKDKKIMD